MSFRCDDMPRPLQIEGRGSTPSRRKSAGTKEKCIFCGTKTYRYIQQYPVCSQCGPKHREEMERLWKLQSLKYL